MIVIFSENPPFSFYFHVSLKSFSFHTRLSGAGTSPENRSCNFVFRCLLPKRIVKISRNIQVGAHAWGDKSNEVESDLIDGDASGDDTEGRGARCSTVTQPENYT